MKYALIFLIVCIGIVSFFWSKIKKVLLSSAKKGSKEDYIKLKAEIEKAIESDDEALEAYDALYTTMLERVQATISTIPHCTLLVGRSMYITRRPQI